MRKWAGLISIKLLAVLFLCFSVPVWAKDFGVQGVVYAIEESDLLDWMMDRLNHLKNTGQLEKLQITEQQTARAYVERPKAVTYLTRAIQNRRFYYDPTFRLNAPIKDAMGNIIYPAGMQFNPLSQVSLHSTLLFFDADDRNQVRWAEQHDHQSQGKTKLILTKGSMLQQLEYWKRALYFDQGGALVKKLRIKHIPAQVRQEGNRLLIEEYRI